jgi:hypothetical protein
VVFGAEYLKVFQAVCLLFVAEQSIKVLEAVFGFLCGFLTKFLLHFIDIHRYASPATKADYLCI